MMLSFFDSSRSGRREFLRVGSLGGLSLASMMATKSRAGEKAAHLLKDRSVVFLFLHGGPSQFETFDPKMTAPSEIRSATGEIKTKLPGITFGSSFPKLAALADRFSIVRSFTTGNGNHDIKPIVCADTLGANIGSIYARAAGANHPNGMPRNVALFPRAVNPKAQVRVSQFGKFDSAGPFGAAYAPFIPGGGGELQNDMKLKLPMARLNDRKTLLNQLDRVKAAWDEDETLGGFDSMRHQAFGTITGGVAKAFDLSQEDPGTIEKYDTAPLVPYSSISKKWNNHKNYRDNSQTLGKLMLLARRMCEAGCGFVTVTTNFVWDMHADRNNATVEEGFRYLGGPLDRAVSAFLEDVRQRGLDDKILLVVCGEMGRTPRINKKAGRDHWGGSAPLMLAGGGIENGKVIGSSDRQGARPHTTPVTNKHVIATIMNTLFDVGELRLVPGLPAEITNRMVGWEPIPGLLRG